MGEEGKNWFSRVLRHIHLSCLSCRDAPASSNPDKEVCLSRVRVDSRKKPIPK